MVFRLRGGNSRIKRKRRLTIASLYQITSTPTIVVIRPDGVIDSVILNSDQDFGKTMEQKKKLFL